MNITALNPASRKDASLTGCKEKVVAFFTERCIGFAEHCFLTEYSKLQQALYDFADRIRNATKKLHEIK